MAIFCVCYNLTKKEQDYTNFYAELEKDGWAHIHSGTCLITTTENALQIQERLHEYSGWATQPYWDWIKKNV